MAILAEEEKKNPVSAETKAAENASPTTTPRHSTYQRGNNQKIYDDTMATLKTAESETPGFSSSYDEQISEIYDKIVNREPFKYDYSVDPMYAQYKESYTQQGKQAMRDTMGQAAALTGGYGSSYGQAVGQQQYDAYLQRLNDVLPELYGMAYDQYADEGAQLQNELSIANTLRQNEYNEYRDAIADEQYAEAWALQQADALAQYGDFSKYGELFGKDTANKMRLTWAASNPDAAYTAGTISADEYYQLTGVMPIGVVVGSDDGGGAYGWNPSGSQAFADAAASVAAGTMTRDEVWEEYNSGTSGLTYADVLYIMNND